MSGHLYLVATPIGNLKDISLRAIETLKTVDAIIVESTDTAQKLLSHYQIKKPLIHLSDENQLMVLPKIINDLILGKNLALISDAGMPTISDPGQFLVKKIIEKNIKVIPIPGASAITTALVASGLLTEPFFFIGFLPKKENELRQLIKKLPEVKIEKKAPTIIAFESPNRLIKTIEVFLDETKNHCQMVVARELTKIYEEFTRGNPQTVLNELKKRSSIKGEITLLISFGHTNMPG
jgi:16S rRNA (cytidine1402-2'-O)-methyltransferase